MFSADYVFSQLATASTAFSAITGRKKELAENVPKANAWWMSLYDAVATVIAKVSMFWE